jgi:AraC family transcriptional activator of pyochelin receptor
MDINSPITPPEDDTQHTAAALGMQTSSVVSRCGDLQLRSWRLGGMQVAYLTGQLDAIGQLDGLPPLTGPCMLVVLQGAVSAHVAGQRWACPEQTHNAWCAGRSGMALWADALQLEVIWVNWETKLLCAHAQTCGPAWAAFGGRCRAGAAATLFPTAIHIDLALQVCVHDLVQCRLQAGHQAPFVLAKALEIMALQAECGHRLHQVRPKHSRSDYDRERLLFARDYLLSKMAMPPSLVALAEIAGINEFKLKHGFKEMFGTTVFGYLAEARLVQARAHLIEGRKTATEIAFELGFSSLQHFSSRFKARYGVTPTALGRLGDQGSDDGGKSFL